MQNGNWSEGFCSSKSLTWRLKINKGAKNVVEDHLSRLTSEASHDELPIDDSFHDDLLYAISTIGKTPWLTDMDIYLASGGKAGQSWTLCKEEIHVWGDPFLFMECSNGIVRRCVLNEEIELILQH